MEVSDLSNLETFLDILPDNKILSPLNDERYIDDIIEYDNYTNAKSLAIKKNRYVNFSDISEYGYSIQPYINLCEQSEKYKCHECCRESEDNNGKCVYDDNKCNIFFAKDIHNWSELCEYHILFLQGLTPGIPSHPGSWNKETEYIIGPLIKILNNRILTLDSEPGLMVNPITTNEYIQKPYLIIAGPADRIHRILINILYPKGKKTLDNTIIKCVSYHFKKLDFEGYINYYEDNIDYVEVMLGIDTPEIISDEFLKYIYSNRFFDRIADIVEKTY